MDVRHAAPCGNTTYLEHLCVLHELLEYVPAAAAVMYSAANTTHVSHEYRGTRHLLLRRLY